MDTETQLIEANVDICMVIDGTGSMFPVLDMVKENALTFHERLQESMLSYNRDVRKLRVKVVVYRDFEVDGDKSIEESEFFCLPEQSAEFEEFVRNIRADGGGDEPESGLDALGYAMHSAWDRSCVKNRNIILMFTDATTKDAGTGPVEDERLPRDKSDIYSWWMDPQKNVMDPNAKRLILFAPNHESWDIVKDLSQAVWVKTPLAMGLRDLDISVVNDTISASI